MSDTIPDFWTGDRVRVMQTEAMVARGLANKVGNIIVIWSEPDGIGRAMKVCRVQFADGAENVPNHSLMRERNGSGVTIFGLSTTALPTRC